MKGQIHELFAGIVEKLGINPATIVIETPENSSHGDYATNVAMVNAGHLKAPPMEIAKKIVDAIKEYQKKSPIPWLSRVEIAPPGFINLFLSEATLSDRLIEVLKEKERYGQTRYTPVTQPATLKSGQKTGDETVQKNGQKKTQEFVQKSNKKSGEIQTTRGAAAVKTAKTGEIASRGNKKKIMVEFTDPNPFKELHIGHLYSNAVGESLARLYEAMGWEVKRADYFGDVGMHVAKSIWGMRKLLEEEHHSLSDIAHLSVSDRVHWLGRAYAKGATAYEGEKALEEVKKEIQQINLLVYLVAQDYMKKTYRWVPVIDYRGLLPGNALDMLSEVKALFEKGREWSMEYFETIFRRLGTKFDYYYPESIVGEYGAKIVQAHLDVFAKSDGAIIFEGEKIGLHNRVFMNSLGLPTYEAKELGLNWKKFQDFSPDLSLNVTGNEINEYFKVLFAVMKQVIPDVAAKTKHIGHGMVRLPQGKMSSRTGEILTGEWLIDEVKNRIKNILDQSVKIADKLDHDIVAEKVAIGAIKYSFLRVALPANLAFDFEKSLSFEGESGPYLMYTYARCKSVERKAGTRGDKEPVATPMNPEEHAIIRRIIELPDMVADAATRFAPNVLCTYLFQLAQEFNLFYAKHEILGNSFRLQLTAATAQVLKNGLYLLGIETLERM